MYNIAVCVSNLNYLCLIRSLIDSSLKKLYIKHFIYCFENINLVTKAVLSEKFSFDIFIIDTEFDCLDGVKAVFDLRKKGLNSRVIYLSDSKRKAYNAIKTGAFDYILKKDIEKNLIHSIVMNYRKNIQKNFVPVKVGDSIKKIDVSKIAYLETFNRGSNIHRIGGTFYIPMKLSELIEHLGEDIFCRCHFSFAVNIKKVSGLKRYEAALETGDFIPISKTRYEEFRKTFLNYLSL